MLLAGLLALGHMHGVNTGKSGEPDDLAIAKDLMQTCYEMYARTPAGLAPEIAYFVERDGSEFPKQHEHDVGGGDFTVKPQVRHGVLTAAPSSWLQCPNWFGEEAPP